MTTADQNKSASMKMKSAIYSGHVRHRRFVPVVHEFKYPLFMLALDLDELPQLLASKWYLGRSIFHPVRYKRADFYGEKNKDLKQCVVERVQQDFSAQGLQTPEIQRVVLVTHLRYFNIIFNPVSFYYCYDAKDELVAIQAEITNTPWKERHSYVLPVKAAKTEGADSSRAISHRPLGSNETQPKHEFRFAKDFHVSPFNPMNMDYRWVFSDLDASLLVHMDNTMLERDESAQSGSTQTQVKHFDATLVMDKCDIQTKLAKTLIRQPLVTVKVIAGIYWQAFKLFVKRSPFYSHPKHEA